MASIWPALRLLTAILRIVALVVLVPVMGPAHAGAGHSGAGHAGSAHAASIHAGSIHGAHLHGAIGAAIPVSADSIALIPAVPHDGVADPHGATGPCCPGCCFSCSAFLAVPAQDMTTSGWIRVGRIAPGSDRPHPSVVPEAIPEPPRPLA